MFTGSSTPLDGGDFKITVLHDVKDLVLKAPLPHKVEEKKISEQNYLILAKFCAVTFAISSTL